jgi:hypothetical protein
VPGAPSAPTPAAPAKAAAPPLPTVPAELVLEVQVVDAATCLPVRDAEVTLRIDKEPQSVARGGGTLRVPATDWLPLAADADGGPGVCGNFPVSPWARGCRFLVPVFGESVADLRAEDAEGGPVAGATVDPGVALLRASGAECAESTLRTSSTTSGDDGTLLLRLPQVRSNRAMLSLAWRSPADVEHAASVTIPLDARDRAAMVPVVLLPVGERRGGHRLLRCGGCRGGRYGPDETAPLTVRVLRAGGGPAAGVCVDGGDETRVTDVDGRVEFAALGVGLTTVVAERHGFLPAAARVEVGAAREVVLREGCGRFVEVEVVDEQGRPVPCVRVRARSVSVPDGAGGAARTGCTLAWMDGDVEVLGARTDAHGRLTWRVPPGRVAYEATLFGAAASVESDEDRVRVVLTTPQ